MAQVAQCQRVESDTLPRLMPLVTRSLERSLWWLAWMSAMRHSRGTRFAPVVVPCSRSSSSVRRNREPNDVVGVEVVTLVYEVGSSQSRGVTGSFSYLRYSCLDRPRTRNATSAGTLDPSTSRGHLSDEHEDHCPAGSPRTGRQQLVAGPRSPAPRAGSACSSPALPCGRRRSCRRVCRPRCRRQRAFGAADVLRDLRREGQWTSSIRGRNLRSQVSPSSGQTRSVNPVHAPNTRLTRRI